MELYAEERRIAIVNISAENKAYAKVGADDFKRFVAQELPEFVTNYFPVSDKPEETYIAGLSMGGYGAFMHGLTRPERYRAIGGFSAGLSINPAVFAADPLGQTEAETSPEYDVRALAQKIVDDGKEFPAIYTACGMEDFLFADNQAFAAELVELGADVTWKEVPGFGHEWRFWDQQVEQFLDWIPRDDVYAKMGKRSC